MATESDSNANGNHDLVVVGSSAGGVGALTTLVSTLDKDFPAPIVLAQHLDPQRPSHLGPILERHSKLPIIVVDEEAPTLLENGKVYVVPANRNVKIVDGHVSLVANSHERPKPSVDILLSTAAQSYGENLIAVILTGSGSDGAAGAVDVKNAGGGVVIQNPATAPYPSMPLSLPPTAVDHVVEMEHIGPLLHSILKGVEIPPTETEEDPLQELLGQVSEQANIDFQNYKSSTILRRIGRRMAITHNTTIRDYANHLRAHPDEVKELVKAFLIKVTGFFRDPEAFYFIKQSLIPLLIEQGRKNDKTLRMWSAGCATGEEAYSLALLVADELGPEFPEWNVKIFATDLAGDAIEFARRGFYPANVLKDLADDYQIRFFERVDSGYRISKALRQVVIFGQQDISRGVPFPRIDLVSCRNLLIYLEPELQQSVLDLFAYSLHHTRGYLFLGRAETTRPTKVAFELINKKWKIYRCLSGPLVLPVHAGSFAISSFSTPAREPRQGRLIRSSRALSRTQPELDLAHLRRVNETMLRHVSVAVITVDRTYRILTINATARRLLGIRDLAYDQDFLHTVQGIHYQKIRNAIDTAFRERTSTTLPELELNHPIENSVRYVNLIISNMPIEEGGPELAIISAVDVTEQVQLKKRLETSQREQSELVDQLGEVNRRFSAMNKELQDANEELQATNEELMLTQEELQAANEEFEATNEELQATNEELETNNEELQATNEELQTTNDELTARTYELQDLSKLHKFEQLQLSALLERFPHYVMVVNADNLIIETINPGYKQMLGDREVIGLPISEVFSGRDLEHLLNILRTAAREGKGVTTTPIKANVAEGIAPVENRFVHTVVPIGEVSSSDVSRLFIYSEKVDGG